MRSVGEEQREVVWCDTTIRRQAHDDARKSGQTCTNGQDRSETHGKCHPHTRKQPVQTRQKETPKGRKQEKIGAHLYTNNVPGTCHTDPSWALPSTTT